MRANMKRTISSLVLTVLGATMLSTVVASPAFAAAETALTVTTNVPEFVEGEPVTYTATLTNNGDSRLGTLGISIPTSITGVTCDRPVTQTAFSTQIRYRSVLDYIDIGESLTCTGTYTPTAADVAAGTISMTFDGAGSIHPDDAGIKSPLPVRFVSTLDAAPIVVPEPVIGTTLLDADDDDKNIVWTGGEVIDTVSYQNLIPGTEYVVSGELMRAPDGAATGITGSTTFTPTAADGTVDVSFTIPTGFDDRSLVAFEELREGGVVVAEHKDITSTAQTVAVAAAPIITPDPVIGTTLLDAADADKNIVWTGGEVIDTIAYQNLVPGTEYVASGELMLADGTASGIVGSTTFTPTTADGTIEVSFTIPAGYAGESLVAFEELREDGSLVAEHKDIQSAAQTVTVADEPVIGTTLIDAADDDKNIAWSGGEVIDTIAYQNLTPGTEYVASGELMRANGSGTGIVSSETFTPTAADGTVDVSFTIPAGYAGETLVAFEEVTAGGALVAEHKDITSAAQTVAVAAAPIIGTTLLDAADDDKNIVWNGGEVIDTIAYQNLVPGTEHVAIGELMLADGTASGITGSTTFTPTTADGTIEVSFTIPTGFDDRSLVAFEEVTAGGEFVAEHKDITSAAQTVTVDAEPIVIPDPAISTTLVDAADDDHNLVWNGGEVIDTIAYQNLIPGTEYVASGELMRSADGTATGITASVTFTPTTADGTVEVSFVIPAGFDGESLVAFEELRAGGDLVAEHKDIQSAAQTVMVAAEPIIGTTLLDAADDDHNLVWTGGEVIDTIAYQNLIPGTEYVASGELMRSADGTATGITASVTFTPTEPNGTVDVSFIIPSGYDGESLVAFEEVTAGGEFVAEHKDITSVSQTVTVDEEVIVAPEPSIGTTLLDATEDDHSIAWTGGEVIDTIAYQNLTPGTEYVASGELMRADGTATGIVGSTTFTPTEANGSLDVSFTIPAGYAGESLVAFEEVTAGGEFVAEHKDITSVSQTVTVEKKPVVPGGGDGTDNGQTPGTPTTPDDNGAGALAWTGQDGAPAIYLGIAALLTIALGATMAIRRRREKV